MEEVWKNIDDRYSISNFGNVKSNYANKERMLKPYKNHDGYLMIDLRSPGKRKSISVHRLVAQAFIPNPDNLPEVNHKDEDKTNNMVDNLEWCDAKYNMNYGTRQKRSINTKIKNGYVNEENIGLGIKEYKKKWNKDHKCYNKEYHKKWRETHPGYMDKYKKEIKI